MNLTKGWGKGPYLSYNRNWKGGRGTPRGSYTTMESQPAKRKLSSTETKVSPPQRTPSLVKGGRKSRIGWSLERQEGGTELERTLVSCLQVPLLWWWFTLEGTTDPRVPKIWQWHRVWVENGLVMFKINWRMDDYTMGYKDGGYETGFPSITHLEERRVSPARNEPKVRRISGRFDLRVYPNSFQYYNVK